MPSPLPGSSGGCATPGSRRTWPTGAPAARRLVRRRPRRRGCDDVQRIAITFLGTSSATPTADRNLAAVAVVLDGEVLLFDCGEATQHQLMRSDVSAAAIEAIFISHLHGDHLYGLPGLIATLGLNGRSRA